MEKNMKGNKSLLQALGYINQKINETLGKCRKTQTEAGILERVSERDECSGLEERPDKKYDFNKETRLVMRENEDPFEGPRILGLHKKAEVLEAPTVDPHIEMFPVINRYNRKAMSLIERDWTIPENFGNRANYNELVDKTPPGKIMGILR